ncbi:MAG: serine hydrolase [Candidatus Poribacteria bacterium]
MEQTIIGKHIDKKDSEENKLPEKQKIEEKKLKLTRRDFLKGIFATTLGFAFLEKKINDFQRKPLLVDNTGKRNVEASISGEEGVISSELQTAFEQFIGDMYFSGKLEFDERTAWLAYDLIRKEPLVSINADIPMQCASMVKPFVALAFFHKVNKGELEYTDQSKRYLRLMIQHSWNTATNWFMKQVGGFDKVNELLYDNYPDIFQHTEIVEYIPNGGLTYKNKASAGDYNRFLIALWNKTIPYADDIKTIMGLPNRDRSGDVLPETDIFHKSGSTARMCGDIAILETKCDDGTLSAYTFIGIIERDDSAQAYMRWKRIRVGVIKDASTIIYDAMKKKYGFG